MQVPSDLVTWLKIVGAVSTGLAAVLLAWRVKQILQWVVYCLVAHEESIEQLAKLADNQPQAKPIVRGVTRQLLDVRARLELILLVVGFLLLGIGMFCNAASYLFGVAK